MKKKCKSLLTHGAAITIILGSFLLSTWLPLVRSKRLPWERSWESKCLPQWPAWLPALLGSCGISSRTGPVTGITLRRAADRLRRLFIEGGHWGLTNHTLEEWSRKMMRARDGTWKQSSSACLGHFGWAPACPFTPSMVDLVHCWFPLVSLPCQEEKDRARVSCIQVTSPGGGLST